MMLNKMKNLMPVKKINKDKLVEFILSRGEHMWISEKPYVKAHMLDFLERLPYRVLHDVFVQKETVFAMSSGRYACAVSSLEQNVIIIFPQVYNLLGKTYDGWAKAVLAHEIGHVYLNHTKNMDDVMEAQVDADNFACDMGYLEELEAFLHDQPESIEKRVRLTFITNYYFSNNSL